MTDWGGKVAAWFGIVCAASAALATLIATIAKPPLHDWLSAIFIILVVIAIISFILLLMTGQRAAWSTWQNRRVRRQHTGAAEPVTGALPAPVAPAPQSAQPVPAAQQAAQLPQVPSAQSREMSPQRVRAILRAVNDRAKVERETQLRKLHSDGRVLRGRISGLGSGNTLLSAPIPAELARWESDAWEALRVQPDNLARFRAVPDLPAFNIRADMAYSRITHQLNILDDIINGKEPRKLAP